VPGAGNSRDRPFDLGGAFVEDASLEVGRVAGVIDTDIDEAAVFAAIQHDACGHLAAVRARTVSEFACLWYS
jgi:hypothetical protein